MPALNKKKAALAAKSVEGGDFEPLEPGIYHAKLFDCVIKEGPKAPYFNFQWSVCDEPYKNRRLWSIATTADNALFRLQETYNALGEPDTTVNTDELVSRVVRLHVDQDTYKGKVTNKVEKIRPPAEDYKEFAEDIPTF